MECGLGRLSVYCGFEGLCVHSGFEGLEEPNATRIKEIKEIKDSES